MYYLNVFWAEISANNDMLSILEEQTVVFPLAEVFDNVSWKAKRNPENQIPPMKKKWYVLGI